MTRPRRRDGAPTPVRPSATRRACGRLLRALAARIDPSPAGRLYVDGTPGTARELLPPSRPGVVPDHPSSYASGRADLQLTHGYGTDALLSDMYRNPDHPPRRAVDADLLRRAERVQQESRDRWNGHVARSWQRILGDRPPGRDA